LFLRSSFARLRFQANGASEEPLLYEERLPMLGRAAKEIESILEKIAASIEDKALVRAEVWNIRT